MKLKIEHLICSNNSLLCVFYTPAKCWQYSLIFNNFKVSGENEIYYSSDAALRVGKELMKMFQD